MRVALIAMPWNPQRLPCPALGALGAFLRETTGHSISCLHEYVEVSVALGSLYEPLSRSERMGELLYAAHLFSCPEAIEARYARWESEYDHGIPWCWSEPYPWPPGTPLDHLSRVLEVTGAHIDSLVDRIAGRCEVAGFTTTAGQLFASLAVAHRLKQAHPEVRIVLGGGGVAGEAGASVLAAFPFVDHVIDGEGEEQLVGLLGSIEAPRADRVLVARAPIERVDELPIPDLREYAALAEKHGLLKWSVPIEGSRRARRGDRPRRLKGHARIAMEMERQCERHENVSFLFVDGDGLGDRGRALGSAIHGLGKQLSFFHDLDTAIHPYDVLRLWEAGCAAVNMNVDGLSTAYLRRIGRATTAIQSLQAMRTCYELGLNNSHSTLLTDFPGATEEEVARSADVMRRFAITYQPLEPRRFCLTADSIVAWNPDAFGVTNIRNADELADAVPLDVLESLRLRWLDFDCRSGQVDWAPVRAQTEAWRDLHRHLLRFDGVGWFLGARSLYYYDGGTFLRITDRRDRRRGHRDFTLDDLMRRVYLDCMEITTRQELRRRLGDRSDARELDELLAALEAEDLIFTEGDAVLSLAVAHRADLAAERIRRAWLERPPPPLAAPGEETRGAGA